MAPCALCPTLGSSPTPRRAIIKRPKTAQAVCRECFYLIFETEIHNTILGLGLQETERAIKKISNAEAGGCCTQNVNGCDNGIEQNGSGCEPKGTQSENAARMFRRGERVAIAASGGKDSTVLAHVMTTLNERYDYGLDLCLLSIDEGIKGYRDDSLETVKRNSSQYSLPLKVLSYDELYQGWTMDKVVENVGRKGNCTFCGVFRRQALDRGANILGVDHIVTGHNADDIAETVLMNVLRGDIARLERCTEITTGGVTSGMGGIPVKRSKPFKYAYEKEIVMYAYFKKLDYFSTECTYSPEAYRGHARALVKELERIRPSSILDIIYSGEAMAGAVKTDVKRPTQQSCTRCGSLSSQPICQACALVDGLNAGSTTESGSVK